MKNRSYDKALYRLISILGMLLKDEKPTIKELSEEFNVSIRTIQMDIYTRLHRFDIQKDSLGRLILCVDFNETHLITHFKNVQRDCFIDTRLDTHTIRNDEFAE